MGRTDVYDITFNGVTGASKKVKLISINSVPHPESKAQALDIPGRSGYLTTTDTAYKPITIKATMRLKSDADRAAVSAWLTGQGDLSFSKYSGVYWKATVLKGFDFVPFLPGSTGLDEFTVQFLCQPYRYHTATTITPTNGGTLTNSGTVEAEPLIVIKGSGDITLTIGTNVLEISDLDGNLTDGITIDTEARLAYSGDTNLTPTLNGDWPIIPTGTSTISWTGTVTSISITPNWRDI